MLAYASPAAPVRDHSVMLRRAALARQVEAGVLPHNIADGLEKPLIRERGRGFSMPPQAPGTT